ncbi:hypothetical protein Cni_G10214 [Canna indica]|uniref:Uncharacterized protein n=1 Tax=Canna indica TaxID=4628 RepID=A0AAQ3QA46_9LILI|nr:hypothetical protein Cni_G10214 [Canna indica]
MFQNADSFILLPVSVDFGFPNGSNEIYATISEHKNDEGNDLGNPDFATRGEWWQVTGYFWSCMHTRIVLGQYTAVVLEDHHLDKFQVVVTSENGNFCIILSICFDIRRRWSNNEGTSSPPPPPLGPRGLRRPRAGGGIGASGGGAADGGGGRGKPV